MGAGSSPYERMIQECEAAIVRIRAAIRAGQPNAEAAGADWELIRRGVTPRLTRYAFTMHRLGPAVVEEALDALFDRLLDDIWSLTYVSIETQLGAYLNTMPIRVLDKIRRKYVRSDASLIVERLDERTDDQPSRHEQIADPRAEADVYALGEREALLAALAALTDVERLVIQLRIDGHENNAIARRLGVSAATATRIFKRAAAELQRRLGATEE